MIQDRYTQHGLGRTYIRRFQITQTKYCAHSCQLIDITVLPPPIHIPQLKGRYYDSNDPHDDSHDSENDCCVA